MSDPRSALQSKYEEPARFANFGEVICRMSVMGFRCHRNTIIEILSPITAFCGMNGTGKSTLLQLASTAYVPPDLNSPRYYINSFLVVGTLTGGIGTRGPGETQLEVDRRRVQERISRLERELESVRKTRAVLFVWSTLVGLEHTYAPWRSGISLLDMPTN